MTEPEPLTFRIPQSPPQQQNHDGEALPTANNTVPPFLDILIHQSMEETEQHDTGLVMWPSALMLSRWITKHPSVVLDVLKNQGEGGRDILELGAGCGLVGLTAAAVLRQDIDTNTQQQQEEGREQEPLPKTGHVIFTDYNATVCKLLEQNARLNKLDDYTSVVGLDFFDQSYNEENGELSDNTSTSWTDMEGNQRLQVSLIFAADIIAYSNDATLVATTIAATLQEGGQAIVMGPQENMRFGLEFFPKACHDAGLTVQTTIIPAVAEETSSSNTNRSHDEKDKQLLVDELKQTSKYTYNGEGVGYDFLMYTIGKPIPAGR